MKLYELIKKKYSDQLFIVESSFYETTRSGKHIFRKVILALSRHFLIIRKSIKSEKFTIEPYISKHSLYPVNSLQLSVFKKSQRKTLKICFSNYSERYFEMKEATQKIFWTLWCKEIMMMRNTKSEGTLKMSLDWLIIREKKDQRCVWDDKYLYLGSKREKEDESRPTPVPGLGPTQEIKLLYLKPSTLGAGINRSIGFSVRVVNTLIYRRDSTNSSLNFKMFMEHENIHAYNVMKNSGYNIVSLDAAKESSTLSKEQFDNLLSQDWSNEQSEVLFTLLPKFGAYATANNMCISNKIFDAYIDHLTDSLTGASDEQLIQLFYSLCQWPETESVRTRNFIEVWAALDETCFHRLHKWSFDEILTFLSLFYMLNVSKGSDYFKKSLDKLAAKAKRLTPNQLVQTLFFIGIRRKQPYDMHNLEIHLENNFEQFNVDELAIMAMGFFKSKTPLRNIELVKKIINKITNNAKNINEVSLAALLKIIRYSIRVPDEEALEVLYPMLDALNDEIPRLSILCNVHIALAGTSKLVFHEKSLNSIANIVYNNISDTRVKDLERLTLSYGTFVFTPQIGGIFFDKIIDELRSHKREAEIKEHGRSFACCVSYLTLLDKYPEDLIKKVLNNEFLIQTYGKSFYTLGKETLTLHNTAEIYLKDKEINRLPDKLLIALAKRYTDYVPSEDFAKQYNTTERMMLDMSSVLTEMRGGKQFHTADHILSHHQRGDFILCNTSEGSPVAITDEHFSNKTFGLIRRPPDHNLWIVLIVVGRNGIVHGTNNPTGQFLSKQRDLRQLGYLPNFVVWRIYSKLKTRQSKIDYLKEVIKNAIN